MKIRQRNINSTQKTRKTFVVYQLRLKTLSQMKILKFTDKVRYYMTRSTNIQVVKRQ